MTVNNAREFDVVILGGGAAGLMCAIEAGKRGRKVAVLEHAPETGRKILISGGGRCNFTNLHCKPENFLSSNPHFCKSALARYTPADFIALVEKHGIPWYEKTLGQLFCRRSAKDIVRLLKQECDGAGVEILLNCTVSYVEGSGGFYLITSAGPISCSSLVIATGGLSIPKMGATSFGYRIAAQFGIPVQPCRPALVPLTFNEQDLQRYSDLSGVSAEIVAAADGARSFREKMLVTHRGLSGPAILQISSYWSGGQALSIDLLPGVDAAAELRKRKLAGERSEIRSMLAEWLPKRLADRWCEIHAASRIIAGTSDNELAGIGARLHNWQIVPGGTEGYDKAEVTAGGVDTNALSSKTMESKKVPGLYFIGEVVDVTGHLGGFNFQWAWASGHCSGQYV